MQVHDGLRAGAEAGGEFMEALHPSYAWMQSDPLMGKGQPWGTRRAPT